LRLSAPPQETLLESGCSTYGLGDLGDSESDELLFVGREGRMGAVEAPSSAIRVFPQLVGSKKPEMAMDQYLYIPFLGG